MTAAHLHRGMCPGDATVGGTLGSWARDAECPACAEMNAPNPFAPCADCKGTIEYCAKAPCLCACHAAVSGDPASVVTAPGSVNGDIPIPCPKCGAAIVAYPPECGLLPDEIVGDRRASHSWLLCERTAALRAATERAAAAERARDEAHRNFDALAEIIFVTSDSVGCGANDGTLQERIERMAERLKFADADDRQQREVLLEWECAFDNARAWAARWKAAAKASRFAFFALLRDQRPIFARMRESLGLVRGATVEQIAEYLDDAVRDRDRLHQEKIDAIYGEGGSEQSKARADAAEAGAAAMRSALEALIIAEEKDECFGMGGYGDAVRTALATNAGRELAARVVKLEAVVAALPRCAICSKAATRFEMLGYADEENEGELNFCDSHEYGGDERSDGPYDLPYAAALRALSATAAPAPVRVPCWACGSLPCRCEP